MKQPGNELLHVGRQPAQAPQGGYDVDDPAAAVRVASEESHRLTNLPKHREAQDLLRQWQELGKFDKVSESALYVKLEESPHRISLTGVWQFPNSESGAVGQQLMLNAERAIERATRNAVGPKLLREGELALRETHQGVVARVTDNAIVVRYGTGDEEFELTYERTQFAPSLMPKKGDAIEACVALWREEYRPKGIDYYLNAEEQRDLRAAWESKKGVRGDLVL